MDCLGWTLWMVWGWEHWWCFLTLTCHHFHEPSHLLLCHHHSSVTSYPHPWHPANIPRNHKHRSVRFSNNKIKKQNKNKIINWRDISEYKQQVSSLSWSSSFCLTVDLKVINNHASLKYVHIHKTYYITVSWLVNLVTSSTTASAAGLYVALTDFGGHAAGWRHRLLLNGDLLIKLNEADIRGILTLLLCTHTSWHVIGEQIFRRPDSMDQ